DAAALRRRRPRAVPRGSQAAAVEGGVSDQNRAPADLQWWKADKGLVHQKMLHAVRTIRGDQEADKLADMLHETLYGGQPWVGLGHAGPGRRSPLGAGRVSLNV